VQTSSGDAKVIIVDDDPFQIAVFTKQLARHGLDNTLCFESGEEALRSIAVYP